MPNNNEQSALVPNIPKHKLIAQEGYPFIGLFIFAALFFLIFSLQIIAFFFFGLAVFTAYFFRNPKRIIPQEKDIVVSPADGKVIFAGNMAENRFLKHNVQKVSIFMSVFNVHLNRAPVTGTVKDVWYNPGKFHVASVDKASLDNEQNAVLISDEKNREILIIQIAGWVARRIVCYLRRNYWVERGARFGLIRFGSRVDIYLPQDTELNVKIGDRVQGGSSIIARLK